MSRLNFSEHTVSDFDQFLERFTDAVSADLEENGDNDTTYAAAHAACGGSDAKFEAYSVFVAVKQGI